MAAPAHTFHYSIAVVDLARSGEGTNPEQIRNRNVLYTIKHDALDRAGIEPVAGEDRGDGFFLLFSAAVPKQRLLGPFVAAFENGLHEHGSALGGALGGAHHMRVRLALHAGEVARDAHGWGGADLNTAFRLSELPQLRKALAAGPRAVLAVAVSDVLYQSVVRHDYPETRPEEFRRISYSAKELRDQHAWIRVAGYAEPPGLTGPAGPAGAYGRRADEAARPVPPPAAEPRAGDNYGIGSMRDIRDGSTGVVHGNVYHNAAPAAADAGIDLRRELDSLRTLIVAALARREIDDEECKDALRELDEATQHAEAEDDQGRGRVTRALRKLRGLLDHVAGVGDAITRILAALTGGS